MSEPKVSLNSIFEERTQTMIYQKDGKVTERRARFLKPCAKTTNQAIKSTQLLGPSQQQWPSKVSFKGWKTPQKRWKEWVDKLALKHKPTWEKAGIFDAIMASSTHDLNSNHDLVLGLSEFWCSETNTFVFPWGEATVTLEDIMVLGGLPIIGDSMTNPVTGDFVKLEQKLNNKRLKLGKNASNKKVTHSIWLQHFVDSEKESELEHAAFLSLWLSRYVFPCGGEKTMVKDVFTIAIHLSLGTKLSLAPPVLASLYHGLGLLKRHATINLGHEGGNTANICVSGPFQLVQLWAFKHFPILGPCSSNSLTLEGSTSAPCQKLNSKITLPVVRFVVKFAENFIWRPYAADLKNCRQMSYYKDVGTYMYNDLDLDEELQSFVKCLCACNLVGIDCEEKYMPYRVAMQFGYDQDLPSAFFDLSSRCSLARFFVPARNFEPGVSGRYKDWWKESVLINEGAIEIPAAVAPSLVQQKNNESKKSEKVIIFIESDGEESDACFTQSFANKNEQDSNIQGLDTNHRMENNPLKRKLSRASAINGLNDGSSGQVKIKASNNSAKKQDQVSKKIKKEVGVSIIDPTEVYDVKKEIIGQGRASFEREKNGLGNSLDSAINRDDDNNMETTIRGSSRKQELDILGRIKKIEELLGVTIE